MYLIPTVGVRHLLVLSHMYTSHLLAIYSGKIVNISPQCTSLCVYVPLVSDMTILSPLPPSE